MIKDVRFPDLDNLIKKMGAVEIPWEPEDNQDEIKKTIEVEGTIKSALEDFKMDENGILYKDGRAWILYIKSPKSTTVDILENTPKGKGAPRYHITGCCSTIKRMERYNKKDRYVFDSELIEKFEVYGFLEKTKFWKPQGEQKLVENVELGVCIHCLQHVKYKDIVKNKKSKLNIEWREDFNVETWFEEKTQKKFIKPKYSVKTYPKPPSNNIFEKKSRLVRVKKCMSKIKNLEFQLGKEYISSTFPEYLEALQEPDITESELTKIEIDLEEMSN